MSKEHGRCKVLQFFPVRVKGSFLVNSSTKDMASVVPGFLEEGLIKLVLWVGLLHSVLCLACSRSPGLACAAWQLWPQSWLISQTSCFLWCLPLRISFTSLPTQGDAWEELLIDLLSTRSVVLKWKRGSECPDCPLQPDAPVCGRPCSAWTSARASSIRGDPCVLALLHVDLSSLKHLLSGRWTATLPAAGELTSGAIAVRRYLLLRVVSHISSRNVRICFFFPPKHSAMHVTWSRGVWSTGGNRKITVAPGWATKVT